MSHIINLAAQAIFGRGVRHGDNTLREFMDSLAQPDMEINEDGEEDMMKMKIENKAF